MTELTQQEMEELDIYCSSLPIEDDNAWVLNVLLSTYQLSSKLGGVDRSYTSHYKMKEKGLISDKFKEGLIKEIRNKLQWMRDNTTIVEEDVIERKTKRVIIYNN